MLVCSLARHRKVWLRTFCSGSVKTMRNCQFGFLSATVLACLVATGCGQKPAGAVQPVEASNATPSHSPSLLGRSDLEAPAGTLLRVRLDQSIDTSSERSGDSFTATLDSPVIVKEKIVIPKGTRFQGHVTTAKGSGRLRGRGVLSIKLDSFEMHNQTYPVVTSVDTRVSQSHKKRNLVLIGGGSGVGALIGGLAGGGTGALIGAGAGAAAGTTGAALTGKKNVHIPVETLMTFSLKSPVRL